MIALNEEEQFWVNNALVHNAKEPLIVYGLPLTRKLGSYGYMDTEDLAVHHKNGKHLDLNVAYLWSCKWYRRQAEDRNPVQNLFHHLLAYFYYYFELFRRNKK